MSIALPERLRAAILSAAPKLNPGYFVTVDQVREAVEAVWPTVLAELAAEQPAPAVLGWGVVECLAELCEQRIEQDGPGARLLASTVKDIMRGELEAAGEQPSAPATPPAVEAAVREALPCWCREGRGRHLDDCPAARRPATLAALRGAEWAGWARAAALEDVLRIVRRGCPTAEAEAAARYGEHWRDAVIDEALAAPAPPSPLAALEALLADLDESARLLRTRASTGEFDCGDLAAVYGEAARRLRAALGLPPAGASPGAGPGAAGASETPVAVPGGD